MEAQDKPLERVTNIPREEQPVVDTDVELQQDFHPEDTDQFENLEHNNPDRLHAITRELMTYIKGFKLRKGDPQNPYTT